MSHPWAGFLLIQAISKDFITRSFVNLSPTFQPTIYREYKSIITQRYNQPSCVLIYVMSDTHTWLDFTTLISFKRFGEIGLYNGPQKLDKVLR